MAEDSRITNVEGELGVASEVTMRRLLEEMKKMARTSGGDPGSQEEKIRKNLRRSMLGEIEVRDDVTDSLSKFDKGLRIASSPLRLFSTAAIGAANVVGNVTGTVAGFGKEILVGGERLQDFTQHLPLVGRYLSGIAGQLDTATDSYRQLTAVGASFNNSILDMYKASIGAAMGFERFNQLILENSNRMNFFAGTVSGGATEIGRLSKQMREGDTANALFNMGFTIEDISEGLINYTQLQARTTGRRIRDENTLIQGTRAYLEEINKLAKITGLNRKEQEQIMLQNMQEANVAVMRSKLTGDARDNFDSSLKLMAANFPGYTAAFKDLMDGIPQTELGKQLASLVPGFSDLAQAAARGEVTQEEFDKRIRELTPRFKELRDQFGPAGITALMQNGFSELFDGMYNIFEYSSKAFDPEKAAEEAKQRDAVTGALTQFGNVVEQIRTGLVNAFIDSGFFENMETFVNETFTSEKIDKFTNDIATFMNAFVEDPSGVINEMFQNIKTYLYDAIFGQIANVPGDGMTEVFRQGGLIESLSNGFRDLFKDDSVIQALKDGVVGITSGITDLIKSEFGLGGGAADAFFGGEGFGGGVLGAVTGIGRSRISDPDTLYEQAMGTTFDRHEIQEGIIRLYKELIKDMSPEDAISKIEETFTKYVEQNYTGDKLEEMRNFVQKYYTIGGEKSRIRDLPEKFSLGSGGFRDFGSGTLAMLHGREAVVREDSEMGQLLQLASNSGFEWGRTSAGKLGIPELANTGWQGTGAARQGIANPGARPVNPGIGFEGRTASGERIPGSSNFIKGIMRALIGNPILRGAGIGMFAGINPGIQTYPPYGGNAPDIMSTAPRINLESLKRDLLLATVPEMDARPSIESPTALQSPAIDSIDALNSTMSRFEESSNRTGNSNLELQKQLNTTMNEMRNVLRELRDINKRIETNTRSLGSNVASGYITNVR